MDQALDEIIVVNEIKTLGPHGLRGGILPGLQEESQGAEEGYFMSIRALALLIK